MNQKIARFLRISCLCFAATFPIALAQAGELLTMDIPFDFEMSGKDFPAGKYTVATGASDKIVLLRDIHCKSSVFSLSNTVESSKPRDLPTLVFRRYGERYFLSEIWLPGTRFGQALPVSHSEREVARSWAKSGPQAVAVARPPDTQH